MPSIAPFMHRSLIVSSLLDDLAFTIIYWKYLAASSAALNANQLPCRMRALKKEGDQEKERKKARLIQHNVYTLSLNAFLSTQRIFGAH